MPQKSNIAAPPLATIGGEPDGRGAIVVEDKLGQAPNVAPPAEETTVDAGKAEPGRDIFAKPPQPDVMSKEKAIPPPAENDEPKAISSVGLPSDSEASETPSDKSSSVDRGDALSSADIGNSVDNAQPEKAKVQGPPDAEQAEADEVRQELFPEAHA